MTVITAAAANSPMASAPARASTAITSTPGWRRAIPRTTPMVVSTRPVKATTAHAASAPRGAPASQAAAPAAEPTVVPTR